MAGFHFSKIHVFKIRGGMVVNERGTLPQGTSDTEYGAYSIVQYFSGWRSDWGCFIFSPHTEYNVYSGGHCCTDCGSSWGVSSYLSTPSAASVLAINVHPVVEVVGGVSSSIPPETSINPPIDLQHQDKGKKLL
ncbi:hypothetical protein Fot_14886 [Forsythia ovata]|uniref:Uncharacterized protein n=1 Tax=Forsythia ovata TaxID=205694 RepID=A0ABD1W7L0_9LAMI